MIFLLPFFLAAVAVALLRVLRHPALVAVAVAAICVGEVHFAWQRAPELFKAEPAIRQSARDAASAWLARTSRRDDVLLGYDPLFLGAWEQGGAVSRTVLPRADAKLALKALEDAPKPLGRGVFVFDASDTNNYRPHLTIGAVGPGPRGAFEVRSWGPFLVLRTRAATVTPAGFLARAREAELVGKALALGDADVNYATVVAAAVALRG
jgi:hypothetical protein